MITQCCQSSDKHFLSAMWNKPSFLYWQTSVLMESKRAENMTCDRQIKNSNSICAVKAWLWGWIYLMLLVLLCFRGQNMILKVKEDNPKCKWRKAKVLLQNICSENALGCKPSNITADTNIQTTLLLPWGILFVLFDSNWVHRGSRNHAYLNYQTKK